MRTVAHRQPLVAPAASRSAPLRPVTWWHELVGGVEWTPAFVAFLYYMFVIITYWLPGADVAMAVALVMLLFRPQDWRIGPALIWSGAFLTWAFVAYGSSPYRAASWDQTYSFLKVWVVAFVAYNVLKSRAQLRFFLIFATVSFTLFPVRGAFFNYFGGYSVWGRALWNYAYANPNDLAAFSLLYAAMAFGVFFLCRSLLIRLGALAAGGMMLALVLFTQSRGAMLAAMVVGAIALFQKRRNPRVMLGMVALAVGAVIFAPKSAWDRLGGFLGASASSGFQGADQEGSAEQRWQLLKVSTYVAADHPVTGVGPGAYPNAHFEYARKLAGELPMAGGNRDPHNTYMRTAAETGYVGLALFLGMIVTTMIRARRAARRTREPQIRDLLRFQLLGLTAFMLAGLFGSFTYLNVLYLTLIVLDAAIVNSVPAAVTSARPVRSLRRQPTRPGASPAPLAG